MLENVKWKERHISQWKITLNQGTVFSRGKRDSRSELADNTAWKKLSLLEWLEVYVGCDDWHSAGSNRKIKLYDEIAAASPRSQVPVIVSTRVPRGLKSPTLQIPFAGAAPFSLVFVGVGVLSLRGPPTAHAGLHPLPPIFGPLTILPPTRIWPVLTSWLWLRLAFSFILNSQPALTRPAGGAAGGAAKAAAMMLR